MLHPTFTRAPDGMSGGPADDPERFAGIRRDYTHAGRRAPVRQLPHPPHAGRDGRRPAVAPAEDRALRADARRADRQPGGAAGQGRAEGDLPVRLAGRGGRQHRRRDVSRPVAVSGRTRCRRWCERINNALRRCDQIARLEGDESTYWMAPIIADAEAGFGGALNAFELMKAMIEAGAAGVHFEDQLASEKKCGHLGGKVLVPIAQHIRTLNAARLAADVEGVPTVLLCRTDAHSAQLLTSDVDERDRPFICRRAHAGGLLPHQARPRRRLRDRPRPGLRALCRPAVVGDQRAEPGGGGALRRRDPPAVPGQDAGLQLLAQLQLAEEAARGADRRLPARHRRQWATGSSS